jgi:hypothetical protein
MAVGFGIVNASPELLSNKGTLPKEFAAAALTAYFSDEEGFDFEIRDDSVTVGIEPTYQYDKVKLISICRDKSWSHIKIGKAWGSYGTQIGATTKYYGDYKYKSKFIKFVDAWHHRLFGSK